MKNKYKFGIITLIILFCIAIALLYNTVDSMDLDLLPNNTPDTFIDNSEQIRIWYDDENGSAHFYHDVYKAYNPKDNTTIWYSGDGIFVMKGKV